MTLAELVAQWQAEAQVLRRRGAVAQADALTSCAAELEAARTEGELEQLTIAQAAAESGYSASQLRRRFPGQRAIPRGALPKKGTRHLGPDLVASRRRA